MEGVGSVGDEELCGGKLVSAYIVIRTYGVVFTNLLYRCLSHSRTRFLHRFLIVGWGDEKVYASLLLFSGLAVAESVGELEVVCLGR